MPHDSKFLLDVTTTTKTLLSKHATIFTMFTWCYHSHDNSQCLPDVTTATKIQDVYLMLLPTTATTIHNVYLSLPQCCFEKCDIIRNVNLILPQPAGRHVAIQQTCHMNQHLYLMLPQPPQCCLAETPQTSQTRIFKNLNNHNKQVLKDGWI